MRRPLIILTMLILAACGGSDDAPGVVTPPPGGGTSATAPGITTQPVAQTVIAPAAASFSVTASGTAPLTYQWRSSANGTDWTAIAGATSASYDTGATDAGMNGRYYSVVVSNAAGSVASASAQLTVQIPPPGPGGEFPHAANPLAVTATRAAEAVSSFYISSSPDTTVRVPDGASNLAVDDGVAVSLGFPGNTFLEDQYLAVTPVTLTGPDSAHPLPFLSVTGAFHLDPADTDLPELETNNLVRVTFVLTQEARDALGNNQLVIFSAQADGSQLHLVPVFSEGGAWSTLTLATGVGHLGIFGLATISSEQAAALAVAWPADGELQLESAMAPASYKLREAALAGQSTAQAPARMRPMAAPGVHAATSDWATELTASLDAYYNDVVAPAIATADASGADLAQFHDAIQKIFHWERQRQLFGVEDERDGLVSQKVHDYLLRGVDKAMQDCSANHNAAAFAQALGFLRQTALMGIDTPVTLEQIENACGRSTYDVAVEFNQVHVHDYDEAWNAGSGSGFTRQTRDTTRIGGKVHMTQSAPELSSLSIEQTYSSETTCEAGAFPCAGGKTTITGNDNDPTITWCGTGFYASYRVERWNLDARGHYGTPRLALSFQNPFGCGGNGTGSSFNVATGKMTKTIRDQNGNSTQSTTNASDHVDTTLWSGAANLGTSSRIARASAPIQAQFVVPGATQRWTTSLTFKVTEIPAGN
jgi:hypothetical protein